MLKSTKNTYISTFICRLYAVKEARPKRKHKKRYKEEKPGRSVFGKTSFPVLFCSRSGTYYALFLGSFDLKFLQAFLIVCIELWLRFKPQICSTRFAINFFIYHCQTERKVRFCVKLFHHFLTDYSSV